MLATVTLLLSALLQDATPPARSRVAFLHATVVPGDGDRTLADHTVLIEDGKVQALGPSALLPAPAGAMTIDARGGFLVPGLVDMHGHPPDAEPEDALSTETWLELHVIHGVTTVRSMRGTAAQLVLRDRLARGLVLGPRLFVAGMVDDIKQEQVADHVAALKRAGYDLVKLVGDLDVGAYRALAEAAAAHGLPFAGHVPTAITVAEVCAAGQCVEHLNAFLAAARTGTKVSELARLAGQHRVPQCPTLDFYATWWRITPHEELEARPGLDLVPRADLERWRRGYREPTETEASTAAAHKAWPLRQEVARELALAGAPLYVSSSHGPYIVAGASMVEEMRRLVTAGIPPKAVFHAATRAPAGFFRDADDLGTVRVGARADLVLLRADPRVDVAAWRAIEGVAVDGRWLAREELERRKTRLRAAAATASRPAGR